jgi:hypothetical protein
MTAPFAVGMIVGTGLGAVILAFFLHGISSGNNAQARFAGTFH